ncbi:Glycosyl Hydrolase Family 88 [Filimonas lacunae]|uniref:Glycosyl Hydrolase Family 88 n=1 Tax=Filimonas lacunae TaxID=477680 RepID=A0A173MPS3_9BACT|nr:glycoside hydrolase family 88 protein [Filimonas lacunae]BAV09459.1 glucuronyl hydrolase [Filimonas lacunae]SIS73558.1 Glycosyl Hydrolase Family 88 [Filimonas lacunae]
MRKISLLAAGLLSMMSWGSNAGMAQKVKKDKALLQQIDKNLSNGVAQYRVLKQNTPAGRFPKTWHSNKQSAETSTSEWWCSGFYPGTLLYLYKATGDTASYNEALLRLQSLEKEQYNTTTHDLGFMMFCSFGNANYVQPREKYKQILINSAKSLASRFNPVTGCIKSWDSKPGDFLVIIDNMMNLELLFWATHVTGDSSFYQIAVTHANTTMKNHFRHDYSSYHVVNYNAETGAVKEKKTAQGNADSSAWARGQAWGLYGYTVMYRETHDRKYLDQANHIASFILNHPNMPADKIPYWDFNAPGIPYALRDASAASVMASAFLELSKYVPAKTGSGYVHTAETMLRGLSSSHYQATGGANGGYMIQHCVGHMPNKTEIDVPLTYADYYFVEAMLRYKAL